MADRQTFERSLQDHYMEYRKAIDQKDGYGIHLHYGAMNNMRRVLESDYGYTEEGIQGLINEATKNGWPASQPSPSPS